MLPPAHSWTVAPTFRFLGCCDQCHRRRLFAPYYEVYGTVDEDHVEDCPNCGEREPGHDVWWWECYDCLIITLTALLEKARTPTPVSP